MRVHLLHRSFVWFWPVMVLLTGCAGVYTDRPLRPDELGVTGECALAGVWHLPGSALEARVRADGSVVVAALAWDDEKEEFSHVVVRGWIVPRRSPALTDRGFISLEQRSETGELLERHALYEYGHEGDRLFVWLPQISAFADAIADGDLQGTVYPGGKLEDPVVLTSSPAELLDFLDDPANTLATHYNAGPGGRLFQYAHPVVLERSERDPNAGVDAVSLFYGGSMTTGEPLPVPPLVSLEVIAAGLFQFPDRSADDEASDASRDQSSGAPAFVRSSHDIPAKVGTTFGVRVAIRGEPADGFVGLTRVWRFPDAGLAAPGQTAPRYESRMSGIHHIGDEPFFGYELRDDGELVPGTWQLELWQGRRRLLVQSFDVQIPRSEPDLPPDGNGE